MIHPKLGARQSDGCMKTTASVCVRCVICPPCNFAFFSLPAFPRLRVQCPKESKRAYQGWAELPGIESLGVKKLIHSLVPEPVPAEVLL